MILLIRCFAAADIGCDGGNRYDLRRSKGSRQAVMRRGGERCANVIVDEQQRTNGFHASELMPQAQGGADEVVAAQPRDEAAIVGTN